jgi:hypothetical protein
MDDAEMLDKIKQWVKDVCLDDTRECKQFVGHLQDYFKGDKDEA